LRGDKTQGLCGDADGKVGNDGGHVKLNNYWLAQDADNLFLDGACEEGTVPEPVHPCGNGATAARTAGEEACAMLRDSAGPFKGCHGAVPPAGVFESCVYDYCDDAASKCSSFKTYETSCRGAGVVAFESVVDRCGVCFGDGTSCLPEGCKLTDEQLQYCAVLSDSSGPYKACHDRVDPADFENLCKQTLCDHIGSDDAALVLSSGSSQTQTVCDIIDGYESMCRESGVTSFDSVINDCDVCFGPPVCKEAEGNATVATCASVFGEGALPRETMVVLFDPTKEPVIRAEPANNCDILLYQTVDAALKITQVTRAAEPSVQIFVADVGLIELDLSGMV
jgi:hypothetical protein